MGGLSFTAPSTPWQFQDEYMTSVCYRRSRERCVAITITRSGVKVL
jgi:hypothetical protein